MYQYREPLAGESWIPLHSLRWANYRDVTLLQELYETPGGQRFWKNVPSQQIDDNFVRNK